MIKPEHIGKTLLVRVNNYIRVCRPLVFSPNGSCVLLEKDDGLDLTGWVELTDGRLQAIVDVISGPKLRSKDEDIFNYAIPSN